MLIAFVLLLPLIVGTVAVAFASDGGAEITENVADIIGGLDLTELQDYIERYGNEYLYSFSDSAKGLIEFLVSGNLGVNYGEYLKNLFTSLFGGIINLLPAFSQVVAISILCAICADVEGGLISKSTAKVVRLACISVILLVLASVLVGVISSAVSAVSAISRQIDVISPILVTLTVLTGGSGTGAIYTPCATFLGQGAIYLVNGVIIPVTIAVMVLNFMSKINPEMSFSGISSVLKSIMKWIMGITVAVFGLFLTVQSTSTSLFNGIFFKVTKYLVGNSVPIVGNFLSSGIDMIVFSGSIVKSAVGLSGVVLLISVVLEPIINLIAFSIMLKITAAIAQATGENTTFALLGDLSKDVEYVLAGIIIIALMYLLTIMLVINSSYAFI